MRRWSGILGLMRGWVGSRVCGCGAGQVIVAVEGCPAFDGARSQCDRLVGIRPVVASVRIGDVEFAQNFLVIGAFPGCRGLPGAGQIDGYFGADLLVVDHRIRDGHRERLRCCR
jgi:hypothetical protein